MYKYNIISPSLFSLFITGFFLLFIIFIFLSNIEKINKLKFYPKLLLLSIVSLVIGIHGLIHLGMEYVYGFNTLQHLNA